MVLVSLGCHHPLLSQSTVQTISVSYNALKQHKCRARSDQPFSEVLPTEDGDLFLANDHDTVTGITSKQKFTIWNDIYRDSVLRYICTIQIRARPNDKLHRRLNIDAHLSAIEPVRVLYGTVGGRN